MSFTGSSMGNYSRLWLLILGIIFLVIGAGMIFALGSIPFAGGTMVLTGGIFVAVGLLLIVIGIVVGRRAAAVDQILATGVSGQAQILGMTQTGMYLNEQPQIELNLLVTVPGQTPYAARHKSFVPLILLGRLSSGVPLAVKVDPVDPHKLVVDWQSTGFSAAPMGGMQQMGQPMGGMQQMGQPMTSMSAGPGGVVDESLHQVQAALAASGSTAASPFSQAGQGSLSVEQLRAYLRQSGLQAQARIDKLTDTGQIVGDERLYTMQTTLEIPGQAPQQQAESAAMVPLSAMHKVRVGAMVPVRYAADNPNLMMFEWDKI
ncbi:MAG: hypothetical protein ABIP53_04000 [Candidatus Limnocylindrales bacterium]